MVSRGILMSTLMVQALLKGTKTQTRRDARLKEINENPDDWTILKIEQSEKGLIYTFSNKHFPEWKEVIKCPYGVVGDGLWVRETFVYDNEFNPNYPIYKANFLEKGLEDFKVNGRKWTPSLYMPKCYSRFDLEITELRIERLQDITEEDAIAEGVESSFEINRFNTKGELRYKNYLGEGQLNMFIDPTWSYISLFEFVNSKKKETHSNPWVWVIKFKDITK